MVDERNERSGTSFVGSFLVLAIGNPLDMSSPYMKYDREIQSGERQRDTKRQRGLRHEASRVNDWGRRYVRSY